MHFLLAVLLVADLPIAEPTHPLWLLERTNGAWVTARTFGTSAYKSYTANTTLAVTCSGPRAILRLVVDVKALGFDSDPFEGPKPPKSWPLLLTTGNGTAVSHDVAAFWGVAALYQVGSQFVFETTVPPVELAKWLADETRGKVVHGQFGEMTFMFTWPQNVEALRMACKPAK
ncbi:MAG: hypothetical protein ACAI38_09725 [Myxococcota bacterium]|nr:hypothetical protein [Myxococcota bacterium]